jgi:hypothetical protein
MDGMKDVTLTTDGACAIPALVAGHTSCDMVITSLNEQVVSMIQRPTIGWKFKPQLKGSKL